MLYLLCTEIVLPSMTNSSNIDKSHASNDLNHKIFAPIVRGSGAIVIHKALQDHISGYCVQSLSPYWGLCPPCLALRRWPASAITHSSPDLGPRVGHPDSDLVTTFHGYYLDSEFIANSSQLRRIFYRSILTSAVKAALRRAKFITAVSQFTADLVQRHHNVGNRLVLIPNGVDTTLFKPAQKQYTGLINILFAGNPTLNKGAEHLTALSKELPEGTVLQYTIGMRSSAIVYPGSSGKLISLPGRSHEEMPPLYQQADILFFPTRREGMSLVVLEAMACGLPVVATRCSSMPELVDSGKGGFLFEMDNRMQMLDYLLRLIRDPALRAEMGTYNRHKIMAKFTLQKMISGYQEVFAACNKPAA
jgi:L-malate glycosyltransferase